MDAYERTRDIYEQIVAYPKPPLIPLPAPEDIEAQLAQEGLAPGSIGYRISKAALALTGFSSFLRQLPACQEDLMRRSDQRGAWLFAPLVSATMALEDDPRGLTPLERAATLLCAARNFRADLHAGRLPPDTVRGQTLEMGQYPNFFATTLILEGRRPRIFKSTRLNQVTVVVRNRFYLLDIGEPDAEATFAAILAGLEAIVHAAKDGSTADEAQGAGLLTAARHVTQRKVFPQLKKIAANRTALETLRHSLLTLCLDLDDTPASHAEAARAAHIGRPANRWWHSSLQLVVFGNAKACAICNFNAYLDGNVMMRGGAEIQRRAAAWAVPPSTAAEPARTAPSHELRWDVPPQFMEMAWQDLAAVLDHQQATFEIAGIGADTFAAHHVEPIPAFILALQMTAERLIAEPVEITQFLTMSRYRCMDLTTASVTTAEVRRFVNFMAEPVVDRTQAFALMREAIAAQGEQCRIARRHLPLDDTIGLLIHARHGLARTFTSVIFFLRALLLLRLGAMKPISRDILVSHPTIYPEVPIVGRPGVRLPYVRYFALHYQIWADKIVITLMPATEWPVSNAQLIAELKISLRQLEAIMA